MNSRALAPVKHDMIALSHLCDALANFDDYAPAFMPEQVGKKLILSLNSGDLVKLRTTDTTAVDLNQDLPTFQGHTFDFIYH
jgi:hypothetical protein